MISWLPQAKRILRLPWFPWTAAGIVLFLAFLPDLISLPWLADRPGFELILFWAFSLTALLLLALAGWLTLRRQDERQSLQEQVVQAERQAKNTAQRLDAIFQLSQRLVDAGDENQVIELALRLSVQLGGVMGASFVPLDERGQPQAAVNYGDLPFPMMSDWVEYLATPGVRSRCRSCELHGAINPDRTCPLIQGPFAGAIGMFCLPLRRGEREFGILNLFIPNKEQLDGQTQAFLRILADETALALEGVRLRRRELETLRHLQAAREKTDYSTLLTGLLEDVRLTLEADFAVLSLAGEDPAAVRTAAGELPSQSEPFVNGLLQGVMSSFEPVLLQEISGEYSTGIGVRSAAAVPLLGTEGVLAGALVVGRCSGESFQPRQLALLQIVAGQVSLLVQNANTMAQLEYKIMLQERMRLAREIHDGLAQTLAFLKLQAAQMRSYLNRNELERLQQSADLYYNTLSEAYLEVRQAIDGLRIGPSEEGLAGWLGQITAEFEEASGLPVQVSGTGSPVELPSEVHAQLIRIVQEALNNVRKHARAGQVWIDLLSSPEAFVLEIRDDGQGFLPQDVPSPSRHGLRGMRERSDLIGADFQIISQPGSGTTIRVSLPLGPALASQDCAGDPEGGSAEDGASPTEVPTRKQSRTIEEKDEIATPLEERQRLAMTEDGEEGGGPTEIATPLEEHQRLAMTEDGEEGGSPTRVPTRKQSPTAQEKDEIATPLEEHQRLAMTEDGEGEEGE